MYFQGGCSFFKTCYSNYKGYIVVNPEKCDIKILHIGSTSHVYIDFLIFYMKEISCSQFF